MRNSEKVRAFHDGIGAIHPDSPTVPTSEALALREALIDEEYREVKEAIAALRTNPAASAVDLTDLASELVDLLYVTYGALSAIGVPTEDIFGAIHEANMLKLTGPKREDGKQLKPEGWQPADVKAIIAAALNP
jgi:predicted HAD superfamily Cof-like phosphohydrolase